MLVWKYLAIPDNAESAIQYRVSNTWCPIFLKIVRYEPDTDTDTDIITVLVSMWNTYLI